MQLQKQLVGQLRKLDNFGNSNDQSMFVLTISENRKNKNKNKKKTTKDFSRKFHSFIKDGKL